MNASPNKAGVFISADMEGCATLVHWDEVRPSDSWQYRRACEIYTAEVNAAAQGAFAAGIQRVVVNDAHSRMRNLIPDQLDPRIELVTGSFKPYYMLQGIQAGGFAAAYFIGYHGGIGDAEAVMGHTYSPRVIFECRLNGAVVGELTINAALAGHFAIPVALVSGDRTTLAEAARNIPWAQRVETKNSMSYYAADCLAPAAVCGLIRAAGADAAGLSDAKPLNLQSPISLEVDTQKTAQADVMEWVPGFTRLGARRVGFTGADMLQAYRALMTIIYLGATA
ncbi:MAG TPA: M55 family metallopeptidase [Candidatus Eremiobacteraceae bacterium]|nr:M55 family metallopeptidase [Candidatus Eremiobacteraceae bacterium]